MRPLGPAFFGVFALILLGCGEPPAPAPVPKEFDDPFADEAGRASSSSAEAAQAPESTPPGEGAGASGSDEATGALAAAPTGIEGAPAEAAPTEAAPIEAAPTEAAPAAVATPEAAPTKAAATTKRPAKAPSAATTGASAPVPSDSTPEPTPEIEPAPAPEPAPVATKPAPETKPEPPPQPPQLRFTGTYKYAGGASQRAEVEAAIEAAAQQVNAVIRGIARKRLTESNPVRESIVIAVDGDKVAVTFTAGRTVRGVLGGPAIDWTSDSGKPVKVAFSLVKGRLVLNFTAEDGARRSTFTLNEAGDRLTMSVTISSERLETPMKYALTYRRS